jgi:hypothetical protein
LEAVDALEGIARAKDPIDALHRGANAIHKINRVLEDEPPPKKRRRRRR